MAEPSYAYRPSAFSSERFYELSPHGIVWASGGRERLVAYRDVTQLRIFQSRFVGSSVNYWNCVLSLRSGTKIRLGAANRANFRSVEDRSAAYIPFVRELEARIAAANPDLRVVADRHWLSTVESFGGWIVVRLLRALRRLNIKWLPDVSGRTMRTLGPWLRGHRTARSQLAAAFPEKPAAEIETILSGMWDNLGRVGAEYLSLGQLTGDVPGDPERSRILIDPQSAERLRRLREARQPALLFTAHIGNWELNATAVSALGSDLAVVYRAPKTGPIADELIKTRASVITATIAAGADTPRRIRDMLKRGWMVGMLVDQYYSDGVEVSLFGKPSKVNPLFARFVRLFDCPVYGVRIVRLPDRRFRFEIGEPIEVPRDAAGKVDVQATMQVIVSIIEGWIREHPEQWLWLHRHWR